jgi:hypothetical protein
MGYIFINWIITVILGSLLAPLILAGFDPQIILICLLVAGLFTLPLITIELISWGILKHQKHPKSWMWYTIIKYIAASLTVLSLELDVFGFKGAALPVLGFWGIPGLLMHFLFLRIKLDRSIEFPKEEVVEIKNPDSN